MAGQPVQGSDVARLLRTVPETATALAISRSKPYELLAARPRPGGRHADSRTSDADSAHPGGRRSRHIQIGFLLLSSDLECLLLG
jgi:hypothetical protein